MSRFEPLRRAIQPESQNVGQETRSRDADERERRGIERDGCILRAYNAYTVILHRIYASERVKGEI